MNDREHLRAELPQTDRESAAQASEKSLRTSLAIRYALLLSLLTGGAWAAGKISELKSAFLSPSLAASATAEPFDYTQGRLFDRTGSESGRTAPGEPVITATATAVKIAQVDSDAPLGGWQSVIGYQASRGEENLSFHQNFVNFDCQEDPDTSSELLRCLRESQARPFFEAEGINLDQLTEADILPKVAYKDLPAEIGRRDLGISEAEAREGLGDIGESITMTFRKILREVTSDGRVVERVVLGRAPVTLVDRATARLDELNVNQLFWLVTANVGNVTKVVPVQDVCENPAGIVLTGERKTPTPTVTPPPLPEAPPPPPPPPEVPPPPPPPTRESTATPQPPPEVPTSTPTREFTATPQPVPEVPTPTPTRESTATPQPVPETATAIPPTPLPSPTRESIATPQPVPETPTPIPSIEPTATPKPPEPTPVPTAPPTREPTSTPDPPTPVPPTPIPPTPVPPTPMPPAPTVAKVEPTPVPTTITLREPTATPGR